MPAMVPISVPLKIARASDDLNQEAGLAACFSRMRSRRVLVLRLGVWGLGVDAKFVRSVRKSPRPKIVAKRRTVVAFGLALRLHVSKVSTVSGSGRVLVVERRTVIAFGLALGRRVSKVSTVSG